MSKFYTFIFTLAVIGVAFPMSAQKAGFLSVFPPGRSWKYEACFRIRGQYYETRIAEAVIAKDSVCGGFDCIVVRDVAQSGQSIDRIFSEHDGVCYDYLPDHYGQSLLRPYFDITLSDGDVIPIEWNIGQKIIENDEGEVTIEVYLYYGEPEAKVMVDYIEVRGVKRKRIMFEGWPDIVWVEGIGAYGTFGTESIVGSTPILVSLKAEWYQDGELIFTTDDFFAPALTEIDEVEAPAPRPSRIYDLSGRPVASPRPGQVYIQANKKFIAR